MPQLVTAKFFTVPLNRWILTFDVDLDPATSSLVNTDWSLLPAAGVNVPDTAVINTGRLFLQGVGLQSTADVFKYTAAAGVLRTVTGATVPPWTWNNPG